MSHFVEVRTQFRDSQCLALALSEIVGKGAVVQSDGAPLFGVGGDDRSKLSREDPNYAPPCHLIIPKQHVGKLSNDIGYRKNADGTFSAYISDWDRPAMGDKLARLAQRYARAVTVNQARRAGYGVTERTTEDGQLSLTLTRY